MIKLDQTNHEQFLCCQPGSDGGDACIGGVCSDFIGGCHYAEFDSESAAEKLKAGADGLKTAGEE